MNVQQTCLETWLETWQDSTGQRVRLQIGSAVIDGIVADVWPTLLRLRVRDSAGRKYTCHPHQVRPLVRQASVIWGDQIIGEVTKSSNVNADKREQENAIFGAEAIGKCMPKLRTFLPEMAEAPLFFLTVRLVAAALSRRERDRDLELKLAHTYLKYNGLTQWMQSYLKDSSDSPH